MSLFQNKYRNETTRLQGYDYSQPGYYFITICTEGRIHFFGEIVGFQMELSEIGKMAWKCWNEIPDHFPFVIPDAFIVMPNHIHGIVRITEHIKIHAPDDPIIGTQNIASHHESNGQISGTQNITSPNESNGPIIGTQNITSPNESNGPIIGTQNIASPNESNGPIIGTQNIASQHELEGTIEGTQNIAPTPSGKGNKFGPQSQNLASIIRGYKIGVTKFCRQNNISFAWQPLFYDNIIRNYKDLQRIRKYIQDNPLNWKEDKFFI